MSKEIFIERDSFLQTEFWSEVKAAEGWRPYFLGDDKILLLVRSLRPGFAIGYVPYGWIDGPFSDKKAVELSRLWKKQTGEPLFLIKWDLPLTVSFTHQEGIDTDFDFAIGKGMKKAVSDIQPPDTVWLDLTQDSQKLLGEMHKKTRYNLSYAQRKGVTVREASLEELPIWYELYQTTAQRDKIAIHSQNYYKRVLAKSASLEEKDQRPAVKLYLAQHEEDILAGIIVLFYRQKAIYLYGASSNKKRELMPAYLLQWTAIEQAKAIGCKSYDFYGIPPKDDPSHPMYGLYRFKTRFGGHLIHRCGVYEVSLNPIYTLLFRQLERFRQFYYKKLRKRF